MPRSHIPFSRPTHTGDELSNIELALLSGKVAGDGEFTSKCSATLEERLGAHKVLLTHSCTAALEMAAILCGLKPGDEVIMPSYTFVSTANAVVLRGAVPVFVDIDPITLNVAPAAIRSAITEKTRAIFVVHYAGVPCEMDAINAIADEKGLTVVEDAAQALGSLYKGRPAGNLAHMAAFSFHETKNLTSGEGGALILSNPRLSERAEIIREKGTNRSRFLRGEVDKYTWVDIGSSYLPSEIIAAYLYGQLKKIEQINADRICSWESYQASFQELEAAGHIRRPQIPEYVTPNGHMYYFMMEEAGRRDHFLDFMRNAGIAATFHYVPLHSSPAGLKYGRHVGEMAVTNKVFERLVRLPLFYGMAGDMRTRVIEATLHYFTKYKTELERA